MCSSSNSVARAAKRGTDLPKRSSILISSPRLPARSGGAGAVLTSRVVYHDLTGIEQSWLQLSRTSHRLAERLRPNIEGEVLFDAFSRGRYSTDASMYQIEPVGVVVPKTEDDVRVALEIAREEGVSLLPRGGGTSQSGQTVGRSLVIDFTKHLNRIIETDTEARTAIVQPGIVLDELNRQLKSTGLWFPVDVSTASRATIGGMTGNNSCGTRSIRYGIMRDNVIAIDAILPDGSEARFGEVGHNLELPLPALRQASHELDQRGERAGVRGSGTHHAHGLQPPLTLTLSPQAGRGDSKPRPVPRFARHRPARGGSHRACVPRGQPPRRRLPDRRASPLQPARQSGDSAVRLGRHARRLTPHPDQAVAAAQEQGARDLPLRHLPQGHGGDPAHRQARPRGGGGGGPHADRARPRHRHVPPGDGNLRARQARRLAAGGVRGSRPGGEPAPPRSPR